METQLHADVRSFLSQSEVSTSLIRRLFASTQESGQIQPSQPVEVQTTAEKMEAVRQCIVELKSIAEKNGDGCKQKCTVVSDQATQAMQKRVSVYNSMDSNRQEKNKLSAELKSLEAARVGLDAQENTLQKLLKEAQDKLNDRKKKQDTLKKFCWVPFYGLGLAIDQLANDRKRVEDINNQMKLYRKNRAEFEARVSEHMKKISSVSSLCNENEVYYNKLVVMERVLRDEITSLTIAMVQWDNYAMYYNEILNKLEARDVDIELVLKELEEKNKAMLVA